MYPTFHPESGVLKAYAMARRYAEISPSEAHGIMEIMKVQQIQQ